MKQTAAEAAEAAADTAADTQGWKVPGASRHNAPPTASILSRHCVRNDTSGRIFCMPRSVKLAESKAARVTARAAQMKGHRHVGGVAVRD